MSATTAMTLSPTSSVQEPQSSVAQNLLNELRQSTSNSQLPSSAQLLRIGGVLSQSRALQLSNSFQNSLQSSFRSFVDALPSSYLQRYFEFFRKALKTLKTQHGAAPPANRSSTVSSIHRAVDSLFGILSTSPRCCEIGSSTELFRCLSSLHDYCTVQNLSASLQNTVTGCLSFLLLDGILFAMQTNNLLERLMESIQCIEEESVECLGHLQEWQVQSEPLGRTLESSLQTLSAGQDAEQIQYLVQMLQSSRDARKATSKPATASQGETSASSSTVPKKSISAADEVERRIDQVRQVLPDFGAGFVESALSLYQGDVEKTIGILLGERSSYPSTLQVMDPKLPRRAKERSADEAKAAKEAREIVKERVAAEAQKEQENYEAVLYVQRKHRVDEYDDDYDDQYDDMDDGGLGGRDDGWLDGGADRGGRGGKSDDFAKVRAYNKVAREEEADQAFWEESRNLNRKPQKKKGGGKTDDAGDDNDDEMVKEGQEGGSDKKYRGPDKIRGGRILDENGRVVRQGRRNKKKGGNGNAAAGGNTENNQGSQPGNPQKVVQGRGGRGGGRGGAGRGTGAAPARGTGSDAAPGGGRGRGKPRTKPKAGNKVNNKRDSKQKKQGAFGVQ